MVRPLWLGQIVMVQRGDEEKAVGERVKEWVTIKVGTSLTHLHASCTGGKGSDDN